MPSTYYVTLATDNNPLGTGQKDNNDPTGDSGDLRYCITKADRDAGSTILLEPQVNNNPINLKAALPQISVNMTIAADVKEGVLNATVQRSNTANSDFGIFNIAAGQTVSFRGFNVKNGFLKAGEGDGAGIYNAGILTLVSMVVSGNETGDNGGGIYNLGDLNLNGASISGNEAADGGGIFNKGTITSVGNSLSQVNGNDATGDPTSGEGNGGGIYNDGGARLTLKKMQMSNNQANGNGGAIYSANSSKMTIQNSSLSNNKAQSGSGGGIFNNGTAKINQNTFNNNSAALVGGAIRNIGTAKGNGNTVNGNQVTGIPGAVSAGGGISTTTAGGASFELVNSIVAQNTAPTNNDVDGTFIDDGHNFIGDGTGGNFYNGVNGDQVGTSSNPLNPMLGPLQDNGGGLYTRLPQAGSPVIDAGDNTYALPTDARGWLRIINNVIDIGAVEYNSSPAPLANATMTLSSSTNPSLPNQLVNLTATVNGGSGTPTGSVTFMDGPTMLGTAELDSTGTATLDTSALFLGNQVITALYSGDDTYASNSVNAAQTVNQGGTTTSLSSSANPAQPGQLVTFTATFTPEGTTIAPTGSVTFLDGTTTLGTGTLTLVNGQYQATFSTSSLSSGSHTITAVYTGDDTFAASSASMTETVGSASGASSSISLTSSPTPSVPGQSVTFTVNVSGGSGTPTGSVTFLDGTTVLGTATLDANGNATFTTSTLGLGSNDIIAVYSGDSTYANSASRLTQSVVQAGSITSVTSSANPSPWGQSVTFTATVAPSGSYNGTPTGTVAFYDGDVLLGAGTLSLNNGQMQDTFSTSALEPGAHNIVAIYSGDSTFADSTSTLTQTITA